MNFFTTRKLFLQSSKQLAGLRGKQKNYEYSRVLRKDQWKQTKCSQLPYTLYALSEVLSVLYTLTQHRVQIDFKMARYQKTHSVHIRTARERRLLKNKCKAAAIQPGQYTSVVGMILSDSAVTAATYIIETFCSWDGFHSP